MTTVSHLLASAYISQENIANDIEQKKRLNAMFYKTIEILINITEQRDPYTAGHQKRVAFLASAIAKKMKLSSEEVEAIYLGALVHDIGKVHVPAEILSSPKEQLSQEEFNLLKTHPQAGFDIIKDVPFDSEVHKIILQHHERLNGTGYPNKLKGKQICLGARIVAVADVYEAMISHRPYRPRLSKNKALAELQTNSKKLYDEAVVKVCVQLVTKENLQLPKPDVQTKLFEH